MNIKTSSTAFILYTGLCLLTLLSSGRVIADPLLNGVSTHSELGDEQFIAGLFVSTLSTSSTQILSSQEEKRLQVRVLADSLSTRRFRRMWIEGMAINSSPAEMERHSRNLASYANMMKVKLIAGDIFTVDRSFERVSISINGTTLGTIDDPDFFDLLLRTWIGPVPLGRDFKNDLLTEGSIKPGPLARFENIRPTDTRIAAVEAGVSSRLTAAGARKATPKPARIVDPNIAAVPRIDQKAPKLAIAPPAINAPSISSPTLPAPKIEETPTPKPTPAPQQVVLAPQEESLDEGIFDEDEDDEFTAESLLKEQLYYSQLARYTQKFLYYPSRAWDRGREGNLKLRVTIDRNGTVVKSEILEAAKYKSLNKEALKAIDRASPYPVIPDELKGQTYTFSFRVAFQITE